MKMNFLSFLVCAACTSFSYNIYADTFYAAQFNPNSGWPKAGEPLPFNTNHAWIYSFDSAVFAEDLANSQTSINVDNAWTTPEESPMNCWQDYRITYPEGSNLPHIWTTTFASNQKTAYFNGKNWSIVPIDPLSSKAYLNLHTSAGKAWILESDGTNPPAGSYFDFASGSWSSLMSLSPWISKILGGVAADGNLYVLGEDQASKLVLLRDDKQNDWQVVNTFPIEQGENANIYAQSKDVVVTADTGDKEAIAFSANDGQQWHNITVAPFRTYSPALTGGVFWNYDWGSDGNKSFYYIDTHARMPSAITQVKLPDMTNLNKLTISPDGLLACAAGSNNGEPVAACYNITLKEWLPDMSSITKYADKVNDIIAINSNHVVASGTDKAGNAAVFYYNNNTWSGQEIENMQQNIKLNFALTESTDSGVTPQNIFQINYGPVWAIGN